MPNFDNPRLKGNLYLTVNVKIPKKLSERQKELFEELANS
jgi:DnaJ-class molecular chaperone